MSELNARPARPERPERAILSSSTSVVLFVSVVSISKFSPNIILEMRSFELIVLLSGLLPNPKLETSVLHYHTLASTVEGLERADSTELDEHTPNPVVVFMPEGSRTHMGSTVRLGSRRTLFHPLTTNIWTLIAFGDQKG
ncbi:hypothetical protein L3X38_018150 [Prunus dulcis]|uniref:Uncharacterized protein n=1 Tax=Prunus dulcis TaxID=3755 RepID=A0AAD4W9H8_PRUDU|nr:hypothetical protein L3X38_018150 [Prunus dulcis]